MFPLKALSKRYRRVACITRSDIERICPVCGLHSPSRHGWRHRQLQDFPAHGDGVTVALQVCRCQCWCPLARTGRFQLVSRDRCDLYAKATHEGAPQALQAADRVRLVQDLRQAIEEQMNLHGRAAGRALLPDASNISTHIDLQRSCLAHRGSRKEISTTINALRKERPSCSEIERQTGFKRRSVTKWLKSEGSPGPCSRQGWQARLLIPEHRHGAGV